MFAESRHIPDWEEHGKAFDRLVDRVAVKWIGVEIPTLLIDEPEAGLHHFNHLYDHNYKHLKNEVNRLVIDFGTSTLDLTQRKSPWQEEVERMNRELEKVKGEVMQRPFRILGEEAIEASRTARELVDLMYRRQVVGEEFCQVVDGLVRWQVLDELQQWIQPRCFSACFESFRGMAAPGGRPEANLYELADKERLRHTLEAIYRAEYGTTVAQGWHTGRERTRQFLLAFMLSLYRHPVTSLYGRLNAFCRFFTQVCGYTFFVKERALQKWFEGYQRYVFKRDRHPLYEPQGAAERRLDAVETLAGHIRNLLPAYGLCPA